ncbi:MAG: serine hydrolase [Bacteroidales bacterium]|jgi:CubicO group peptidase (beta-lactamase class C family)|nr:serine hydrolase [Bacteroidales bacterium]
MKKLIKRVLWILLIALIIVVTWFAWPRLPIITAFAAKGMCSSVFLADKSPERVAAEDLSFFPISLAKCKIDYEEKSVTAKVLGLAKRKVVFREGLGSVIVLEKPEEDLMADSFDIPDPDYCQDTIPWPLGDVLSEALPEGVDYQKLESILDEAIDKQGEEPFKKTLGVAVVYNNELVGENYLEGYDAWTKFHGWSMTKSVTGALTGALVQEGKMDVRAETGIPEWAGDARKNITVENILHMSSGLEWVENYFTISDATVMLMQSDDMFASIAGCELTNEPGSFWNYSSGDANLLSGLIRNAIGNQEEYHGYAYTRLFHRIGMLNTIVETDASGLFVASSYSYGSIRDWARFGMLFLNNGIFEGDTVLTQEWVEYMRSPAPASEGQYAGTFWLKESDVENALVDVPEDIFFADGFLGQRIYIIPSKKLVVVRMGYSLSNFSVNDFLRDIIATLPE